MVMILVRDDLGNYPLIGHASPPAPHAQNRHGLFAGASPFLIVAWIQMKIDVGQRPNIGWQILAFLVSTAAEGPGFRDPFEFAYTQAPKKMKSLVMCTYLGAVSLGNVFTAAVNFFIQNPDGSVKLAGASYFFFFAGVMFVTALIFLAVAGFYRGKTHIQDSAEPA